MPQSGAIPIARTLTRMRDMVSRLRAGGGRIALVPTMGALHEGHLALIRRAQTIAEHVVVSIFVNPTQFGPDEDYSRYPRCEKTDQHKLSVSGVDLLYAPSIEEMYPNGFSTTVQVTALSNRLCGESRPGHFDGVATVVTKLFNQVQPHSAVFGEKDYQQLLVIRRLIADLDLEVIIESVPIIRDSDGLALSSRNAYLNTQHRRLAPQLHQRIEALATALTTGADVEPARATTISQLKEAGFDAVDYLAVCNAETLAPATFPGPPARVFAAVKLGQTRLIDNVPIPPKSPRKASIKKTS